MTKIFHVNKLDVTFSISKNEPKTFDELEQGDTVYVWWLDKLYSYEVSFVDHIGYTMDDQTIDGIYDLRIHTKDSIELEVSDDYRKTESFIYGTDGWHEYKIFGTSKKAVKQCLIDTLATDEKEFNENKKTWLKEFE